MNPETGTIYNPAQIDEMTKAFGEGESYEDKLNSMRNKFGLVEVKTPLNAKQRRAMQVDKYDPCPCGSGKQFKWCCYTGK